MKFNPEELETGKNWILGTKLKSEDHFYLQVVTDYKRYSSLFTKCLNDKNIDFYFMEIELPIKLKPETVPF